jgi:hypothetical protein
MKKKFRTPPEKKRLSLKRDCRGRYGQNDKASRKLIPLRKRLANRKRRRAEGDLRQIGTEAGLYAEELENKVQGRDLAAHRKRWRKSPDAPLRAFMERQRETRIWRGGRKKRSIFSRRYEALVKADAASGHKNLEIRPPCG